MTIVHSLTIDMLTPGVPPVVNAMQLDNNTRVVNVSLWQGAASFNLNADAEVTLACIKSDQTKCWYNKLPDGSPAIKVDGNIVSVTLAPDVLNVAGTVKAALVIRTDLISQFSTFPFVIHVAPNPAAGSVISNNYYKISSLEDLNAEWKKIEHQMDTVIQFTAQKLTLEEQAQARANIGAMSGTATIENGVLVVSAASIENNILVMK